MSYQDEDENCVLTNKNQSSNCFLLQCYESHSSLIRILLFIFLIITWSLIIIYILNLIGLQPKIINSNEIK